MTTWTTQRVRRRRGPARARPWRAPAPPCRRCSRMLRTGAPGRQASGTRAPAAPAPSLPALGPACSRRSSQCRGVVAAAPEQAPGRGREHAVCVDPLAVTIPPPLPSPAPPTPSLNLSPSLLIIGALLAFVFCASVSIHFLLRCISRQPSPPALPTAHRARASSPSEAAEAAAAPSARPAEEVDDEKERLIASLPLFTMASALAALPKSSPDCAVCLSAFQPDAELRLLPACRHAFHAACVDAWLRTTPSCPLCRAGISLPHPPLPAAYTNTAAAEQQDPLDSRSSRSFRVEIGSISNRRSSAAGDDRRTYSLGSFDYRVDEEVEAVVARIARPAAAAKSSAAAGPRTGTAPHGPGEALAEAAGSRGWLREYVDRLASSASSLSGRWSARWSQSHHSHRQQEESWRWDPEAAAAAAVPGLQLQAAEEEEGSFMGLYRWIVGV